MLNPGVGSWMRRLGKTPSALDRLRVPPWLALMGWCVLRGDGVGNGRNAAISAAIRLALCEMLSVEGSMSSLQG